MAPALLLYALAAGILLVTAVTIRLVTRTDVFSPVTEMDAPRPHHEGDAGPWVSPELAGVPDGVASGGPEPGSGPGGQ